jgi:hypothetical protein
MFVDRQVPRHTSEIRQQILTQLRALSAPIVTPPPINLSTEKPSAGHYNPSCPRGRKGNKGQDAADGGIFKYLNGNIQYFQFLVKMAIREKMGLHLERRREASKNASFVRLGHVSFVA